MMTNWVGEAGIFGGRLEVSFASPVRSGDSEIAKGKVTDKIILGKHDILVCEVSCEKQDKKR